MSIVPVLPRTKEGLGTFDQGKWNRQGNAIFETLSDKLDVPKIVDFSKSISSIPDFWARPLLVEMAICDKKHPLHEKIIGEWRGLLALVAFSKVKGYNLEFRTIKVEEMAEAPPAPKRTLDKDLKWDTIKIIYLNGRPIGMTSPTTLVCGAVDAYNCYTAVSWGKARYLTDPTKDKDKGLGNEDLGYLLWWMNNVIKSVTSADGGNIDSDRLIGVLRSFRDDIKATELAPAQDQQTHLSVFTGVLLGMDTVMQSPELDAMKSFFKLEGDRTDKGVLLVIDPHFAEKHGTKKSDIHIFNNTTLDDVTEADLLEGKQNPINTWPRPRGTINNGNKWCLKDALFTNSMLLINQQDALPNMMKPRGSDALVNYTPIPPIKPFLLNYLSPTKLKNCLTFTQVGPGVIDVKLDLPIKGAGGTTLSVSQRYEIGRKADPDADIRPAIIQEGVPVVEVWPNIRVKGNRWKRYYIYYDVAGVAVSRFVVKPISDEKVSRTSTGEELRLRQPDTDGYVLKEIVGVTEFPEALQCSIYEHNPQSESYSSERQETVGVILLNQPTELSTEGGATWQIGIDFGTTNTNVYFSYPARGANRMVFHDQLFSVTKSPGQQRANTVDQFIPSKDVNLPFRTLFNLLDEIQANKDQLHLFKDGHIYYFQSLSSDSEKWNRDQKRILHNLKWSGDSNATAVEAFLLQLALQSTVEAVQQGAGKICWSFSYPTAFDAKKMATYKNTWKSIEREITEVTGIECELLDGATESVAAAYYFVHPPLTSSQPDGKFYTGAVSVDIGGGTSDIAVWQNNLLLNQISVKYAGRDLLLDLMYKNKNLKVLERLVDEETAKHLGTLQALVTANDQGIFNARLETLMYNAGDKWLAKLARLSEDKDVARLCSMISFGLAGLFYYTGMMVRQLVETSTYKLDNQGRGLPALYIGGNGSKLLHWTAYGDYDKESPARALFEKAFVAGCSLDDKLQLVLSKNPKSECAYGLVAGERVLSTKQNSFASNVVAGEQFTLGNQDYGPEDTIDAEMLIKGIALTIDGTPRISEYISLYNTFAKGSRFVQELKPDLRDMVQMVNRDLGEYSGKNTEDIETEPVFILELKRIIKQLMQEY